MLVSEIRRNLQEFEQHFLNHDARRPPNAAIMCCIFIFLCVLVFTLRLKRSETGHIRNGYPLLYFRKVLALIPATAKIIWRLLEILRKVCSSRYLAVMACAWILRAWGGGACACVVAEGVRRVRISMSSENRWHYPMFWFYFHRRNICLFSKLF